MPRVRRYVGHVRTKRVGANTLRVATALTRTCPKCKAAPGHSCTRPPGGRVCGEDIGGGYAKTLKKPHPER
jgi:hypothetical protein